MLRKIGWLSNSILIFHGDPSYHFSFCIPKQKKQTNKINNNASKIINGNNIELQLAIGMHMPTANNQTGGFARKD